MSRVLASILGLNEASFASVLRDLERASGHPGVDVRFLAEMTATVHQKTRQLGMDPRDTTGRELYHALQALTAKHDQFLAQKMGASDAHDVADMLPRIIKFANELNVPRTCWAIKPVVLKRLLKASPPKKVMKQLGYRSIDSMLKRESTTEILAATHIIESKLWQERFVRKYKNLRPGDFEVRQVEVILCNADRWGNAASAYVKREHRNVTHLKELGAVMVLPLPVDRMRGLAVTLLPLILHFVSEIRFYSALFKLQQVQPNFGELFVAVLLNDETRVAQIAGHPLPWQIVSKHFGRKGGVHPSVFEPHVQPEDLYYRKAESILYWVEPALKFWEHMDYVAAVDGDQVVPLGLLDNAVSYCNKLEYGQHSVGHVREGLWDELLMRYMAQESLEQQVIDDLGTGMFDMSLVGAH